MTCYIWSFMWHKYYWFIFEFRYSHGDYATWSKVQSSCAKIFGACAIILCVRNEIRPKRSIFNKLHGDDCFRELLKCGTNNNEILRKYHFEFPSYFDLTLTFPSIQHYRPLLPATGVIHKHISSKITFDICGFFIFYFCYKLQYNWESYNIDLMINMV